MPWNSDEGGGGKGPWGQGPWGQGPKGPRNTGRGPNPPDLDELLQRGKDSLKNVLPAGGRGSWLLPLALLAAFIASERSLPFLVLASLTEAA